MGKHDNPGAVAGATDLAAQGAGRALAEALRAKDPAETHRAVATWRSRLDREQRLQAVALSLAAAEPGDVLGLLRVLAARAGEPLPAFLELADEAADWASWAALAELRAYAAACAIRLPKPDRAQLAATLSGAV